MKDLPRSERGKYQKTSNMLNEAANANGHTYTVNTAQATNNQTNPENSASATPTTDNTGGTALENNNTPVTANVDTNTVTPTTANTGGTALENNNTPVSANVVTNTVTPKTATTGGTALMHTPISSRMAERVGNITSKVMSTTKKKGTEYCQENVIHRTTNVRRG